MGGVSSVSQNQRSPIEMEAVDNCDIDLSRGLDKRAGTEMIEGPVGSVGQLDVSGPTENMHFFWINRDASNDEQFVGMIQPDAGSDLNVIQIFNITTGAEVTVEALDSGGSEVALDDADTDVVAMLTYLKNGTQTPQQRYRTVVVEDGTFILNRTVLTALEGTAITYKSSTLTPVKVRNQNNDQNVTAWSDFTHPPASFSTYPTRTTLVTGGDIVSDSIWYASDDDVGLPQGFYWATTEDQPPWFQRLPTEPALSYIQRDTMPLLLAFDGTKFVLQLVEWEPRKAGDSTTNPGPSFIGKPIDDISFHQGRLWFASGERIVSSRAGDIYNLWIDSVALVTDADPIDDSVQGNRVSNIRVMEAFRETLIFLTDGARQLELRANGPITPQSYQLFNSTDIFSANYVEPERRGSQMYFAGERDAANLIWEYDYSPAQVSNVAFDMTRRVHGYIPAEMHWMTSSNAHDQLYCLTLADLDAIYVNTSSFDQGERVINSWMRWVYPGVDAVRSCNVFDDYLYCIMQRDSLLFLERQALGEPLQDAIGSQTLGYATRVDSKLTIQGVYAPLLNETVFTLPYLRPSVTYQIVTGPTWDTTTTKGAGTEIPNFTVGTAGGFTTLTVDGDVENNADGTDAPCYIGLKFSAEATLSQVFVRDENQTIVAGNTHLMRMRVRHRDSGGYSVKVTPEGRATLTHTFVPPNIGSTALDVAQLDDFGEVQLRVMSHAHNSEIQLVNETPFPTAWIDGDFDTTFVRTYSPVR
jgi:hypothetical protein